MKNQKKHFFIFLKPLVFSTPGPYAGYALPSLRR